jgi:hypothetical protein
MDFKGWTDLDTRQWWIAVVAIAGSLLVGAGTAGRTTTAIIAAGALIWGIGEWIQHPFQQFRKDGQIGNRYTRVQSLFGIAFNLIGIATVILAVIRFWRLGGSLF